MPNLHPHVSVIITNYNYGRFLRRSIESVLCQSFNHLELIVVDDASTDGSRDIINAYGDRLTAVLQAENQGHAAGFNRGFACASGDIIIFLDADDFLYPSAIETVVAHWHSGLSQIQFRLDLLDENENFIDIYPKSDIRFDDGDVTEKLIAFGRYRTTVTSGLAFSRQALANILPMPVDDFRCGADGYLVTLAPLHGQVASIEQRLGCYRIHGKNHSIFGHLMAARARWRIEHDLFRYKALASELARLNRSPVAIDGSRDPMHLEQRMISLRLEPDRHPIKTDRLSSLMRSGLRSARNMASSQRNVVFLYFWFSMCGAGPQQFGTNMINWRFNPASRPHAFKAFAKTIRRMIG